MVQVLTPTRQKPRSFAQEFAGGLADAIPGAIDKYQHLKERNREKEAVSGLLGDKYKNAPSDFQNMAFQAKLNEEERLREKQRLIDLQRAKSQATYGNENGLMNGIDETLQSPSRSKTNNKQLGQEPNIPVMSPRQVIDQGVALAERVRNSGQEMSDEEGIAQVQERNNANINYQQHLTNQENENIRKQEFYGNKGLSALQRVLPDASPKIQDMFQKEGENLWKSGDSEAEISSKLNEKAKTLANNIDSIERLPGPTRIHNGLYRIFNGTYKGQADEFKEVQRKIKPLLDQGLYEETRNLLSEKYQPEEVENLITSLGEGSKKVLADFPKFEKYDASQFEGGEVGNKVKAQKEKIKAGKAKPFDTSYLNQPSEDEIERLNTSVKNAVLAEPSVNLLLLRKAYEDKNVNYQQFRNALGEALVSGEIKLNEEQLQMMDKYLDTPPLYNLDKLWYKLGFTGR